MSDPLTTQDHDRRRGGRTYVYPVVSRRARGVSVGVNLNPNNACNWRCVYCQVPDLVFGNAPLIDLGLLERELRELLLEARTPQWLESHAPEGSRRLNDVAISGNGEPTSSRQLPQVVEIIASVLAELDLLHRIRVVLITNGSLLHLDHAQASVDRLAQISGEVWFKVDSATDAGLAAINNFAGGAARQRRNLEACARACSTWIQTCMFEIDGQGPTVVERAAYLDLIESVAATGVPLGGVHLYSLARESHQPEAGRLSSSQSVWLEELAREIHARGVRVEVSR